MTLTIVEYVISSAGWFLAGVGSTCMWREMKSRVVSS